MKFKLIGQTQRALNCRSCDSPELLELVDFGSQPLAGYFPLEPECVTHAPRFPLELTVCGRCSLLQVTQLPPINQVFHEDYRYSSSAVPGLLRHFDEYSVWLAQRIPQGGRVLEFGCNDGILLARLAAKGFACVGVDASKNVAQMAQKKGLDVRTGFFTRNFVRDQELVGKFDLVTCSNVFAHMHNIADCAGAAWAVLVEGGRFVVEVHNGESILAENQFDTIYHEHLTYFTPYTLSGFLVRHGFEIEEVARTNMHGDGLRVLARKIADVKSHDIEDDKMWSHPEAGTAVRSAIATSRDVIRRLFHEYGPLVGYGAAGRSQMFINFTETGAYFSKIFDDSPLRQGRYIAGTDIMIQPYTGESGRCCVILAWNYAKDIASRIRSRYEKVVTVLPAESSW